MARVMIVEDSYVVRKALGKIMAGLGHTVVAEVADGAQAVSEYSNHQPDIVTMDLTMPGMSGAEATSQIIARFPAARIIVISASEEKQVVLDALERGARHYIIKPITPEKVAATIDNVLQQQFDQQKYRELIRKLKAADDFADGIENVLRAREDRAVRVLIVDDSAVARKSLREIVTALGYTVAGEAGNGSQAFVEYTRCKPDIVTMDLTMQGINGAEATSRIIATFPEARIVVISAMEERRVVIDALERGARHFVIKPITREKIEAVLGNVLRQKFDPDKHRELVGKLKATLDATSLLKDAEYLPPYRITRDDKVTLVEINATLTLTSCQSLSIELGEFLADTPRVLFDFGSTPRLRKQVLAELGKLVQTIESNAGKVKAASRNPSFVELVSSEDGEPYLAAVLQYFAG
jgi:DNA-binding NarL/FixJ family response regulator